MQTSFLDTLQSSLLSGNHTPAKFYENEQQMDGSQICKCGKETFGCSIHPNTPEAWIALMQDSLAKTLATLENRPDLEKALGQGFTEKSCVSLAWYDQESYSWKTYQQSLVTDWEPYSETWPRWGMTVAGVAYEHPMSVLRIKETDGSFLPTPTSRDYKGARSPEAMAATGRNPDTNSLPDATEFRGKLGRLNPMWVEWLMGWPIGWTESKHWGTDKSRCKQQSHSSCSVKD